MAYKDDTKFFNERAKSKIKCRCGHILTIPSFINKKLCSCCGLYVYRESKEQFKYTLPKLIKEM